MSQPVKLSDALVLDARLTGEIARRSIAGQIEYWARLGRAIEPVIQGGQALTLCQADAVQPLSACLGSVDTEDGHQRLAAHLESLSYPRYEPSDKPGWLVQIEEDGTRTLGRFIRRKFQPARSKVARR